MSAPISLPPQIQKQAHVSPASGTPDAEAAGGEERAFGAIFRQISEQNAPEEANPGLSTPSDAKPPPEDLAPALPFLESMGLLSIGTSAIQANIDTGAAHGLPGDLAGELAAISAALRQAAGMGIPTALPLSANPVDAGQEGEASPVPPASTFLRPLVPAWEKAGAEAIFATATATAQGKDFGAVLENLANLPAGASQAALAHPGLQAGVGLQASASYGSALPLAHSVGTPAWGQELGQRIVWMANSQESQAELVLTPPQLGRVAVSLSIIGDQATASFVCANPVVREALEAALPRLRETLAEAGIQLGQAHVGAEHPGQSGHPGRFGRHADSGHDAFARLVDGVASSGMGDDTALPPPLKSGRGLVDVFA